MAKRKTLKRKRPRTSVRTPQALGFDYGCLPYAMAVGAFEFCEPLAQGVRMWQVEQAICNLVLSKDAGLGPRRTSNSDRKADKKILQALSDRYEVADNTNAPAFSLEEVVSQVLADGNVLLRNLGEKPKTTLIELQGALAAVSALDAPSATADVAARQVGIDVLSASPDRLRVFVSSTIKECAEERAVIRELANSQGDRGALVEERQEAAIISRRSQEFRASARSP